MPKVVSYTPAWLSSPAPGQQLFEPVSAKGGAEHKIPHKALSESTKRNARPGPRRNIARRGTEVFIAVGREIRWADLVFLKDSWEEKQENAHGKSKQVEDVEQGAQGYRIIKTHVADDIRQLIISPQSNYLAILTTHTIHIAVLPDSSHLTATDTSPLKLKTFTLGPVTHVTTQPAIAAALWHPLGVNGSCLVTVTEDAVVRLWELNPADRWSFDRPTLAIDLQKLADGTSLDQDFGASVSGASKGFSPDSFEMEVAAACFGGRESGGWSPMTLWVAMREGDVYALCPLLPGRWAPPPMLIPSLSISIVAKVASMEEDPAASIEKKLLSQQQLTWMSDLDSQEPTILETSMGEYPTEIFTRPHKPGRIPKLQGPFDFDNSPEETDDELDNMLSDIYVIGGKVNVEELMAGEEEEDLMVDDADQEGLSIGVVCLLTNSGRVSICLDIEGIEAQWLPKSKSKIRRFAETTDAPSLLTYQTLETLRRENLDAHSWPMFSEDVVSRYSFYITHSSGVTFMSLAPWAFRLESELHGESASGIDFRIDLLVNGENSARQRIISRDHSKGDKPTPLAASTVVYDSDLGYFLLTCTPHRPVAVSFDIPEELEPSRSRSPTYDEPEPQPLLLCPPRSVYQPSEALNSHSALPALLDDLRRSKYKRVINEPVRLSPATLTFMTDAHKILSEETHRLGLAAAELFRRCERLQIELREQIGRANEVANRIESVIGDDVDVEDGISNNLLGGNDGIEQRLQEAKERQAALTERIDRMRKKAGKGGNGRELSDKEKTWISEVSEIDKNVSPTETYDENKSRPWQRLGEVKTLAAGLLDQVSRLDMTDDRNGEGEKDAENFNVNVPSEIRKQKVAQVMRLLERESALVEAAKGRLERLSAS